MANTALIARVHLCIGDGVALISVMLSITDGGADPPKRGRRDTSIGEGEWLTDTVMRLLAELSAKALSMVDASLSKSIEMLSNPQRGLLGSLDKARTAYRVLGDIAVMALMSDDSPPGPATPLLFCGSTLPQTMFWVPASGSIGVGVSILSHGGGVQFGLITDEAL